MKGIILLIFKLSNSLKSKIFTFIVRRRCKKAGKGVRVNGWSNIGSNVILGNNVNINGMYITSGGMVIIGDNFHSGKECMIIVQYHNYDSGAAIPYDSSYIIKNVFIKDNVWIGSRVIILGGVTIGEGAIIQAGAVVVKSIPDLAIAGGNPATVFKYRDKEHYYKLRDENKFH